MLITWNWLKYYINFHSNITPSIINDKLTDLGIEVEDIIYNNNFSNIMVVQLLTKTLIEGTKLNKCIVFNGIEKIQVICGGQDLIDGEKYVFAPVGSVINSLKIKKRKLQGYMSEGMLCSYEEVGINYIDRGKFDSPMAYINDSFNPGDCLDNYLNDIIFKISITYNRSDLLSIEGIARELISSNLGSVNKNKETSLDQKNNYSNINLPIDCSDIKELPIIFTGRIIKNISTYTPFFMKCLLSTIGVALHVFPVDLSNFFLYGFGQPIHVYDFDYLINKTLKISSSSESFVGLNNKSYNLGNDLVLKANNIPISLLGILGGEMGKVTHNTKNIFVEIGAFPMDNIFNSCAKLKINTFASNVFIHKFNHTKIGYFHELFLSLINVQEYSKTIIYINNIQAAKKNIVYLSQKKWYELTQLPLSLEDKKNILCKLGFEDVHIDNKDGDFVIGATMPSWRCGDDISENFLIQEIIRHYSFQNIKEGIFAYQSFVPKRKKNQLIRDYLLLMGYNETINFLFVSKDTYLLTDVFLQDKNSAVHDKDNSINNVCVIDKNNIIDCKNFPNKVFVLENPIGNRKYMRRFLIGELYQSAIKNNNNNFNLFEIGEVQCAKSLHKTHINIGGIVKQNILKNKWHTSLDIFDIKNHIIKILSLLDIMEYDLIIDCYKDRYELELFDELPIFNPYKSGTISIVKNDEKVVIGCFGYIHPKFSNPNKETILLWEVYDIDSLKHYNSRKKNLTIENNNFDISIKIYNQCVDNISSIKFALFNKYKCIYSINMFDYYVNDNYISIGLHFIINGSFSLLLKENIEQYLIKTFKISIN